MTRSNEKHAPTTSATDDPSERQSHVAAALPPTRLIDVDTVIDRYRSRGPHTTVVLPVATPGQIGDDLTIRWHATRTGLRHQGASDRSLDLLDAAVDALSPTGGHVLLTANDDDAAYTWLTTEEPALQRVGPAPCLIPALGEVVGATAVVVAAVDRIGADLYLVDHTEIEPHGSITGEDAEIHKAASGGWSQARRQRHSEVVWERNAAGVASELADLALESGAALIVITGDQRATELAMRHLDTVRGVTVRSVDAGGRHEPDTWRRLHRTALEIAEVERSQTFGRSLEQVREELGQQDRAVAGAIETLQAISENRVGTLFIDTNEWRHQQHADEIVKAALLKGAQIVPAPLLDIPDGIAGLLRVPYRA